MKNMKPDEKIVKDYQVGDIVRTTESFGPNPAGSLAMVYETYPDNDVKVPEVISIILTNGHDIGSFNHTEQTESLTWLGNVDIAYVYSSPSQLMADYRDGYFNQAFAEAQVISEQVGVSSVV
ncbi:hypothetical protein Slin_6690 (plasmid) [Spirosoma linguale DSM 74]|uniref:Uncharacterized protein n=2 Tax=Spirosoma TaxID=107 RepID=D2QV14_SPILD|nr:hypothetical protein Slin_6690 [Spirosoma linguale DSM 74]